ncbi:porin [Polaromonas sp.]|uniref:porin n=1 Tax=Polaromonas sp. TaxID=1869339 RepID=UPI003BAC44EE
MKKSLIALAALAAVSAASAQSSVTMYGVLDIGYGSQKGQNRDGSVTLKSSGVLDGANAGNRIGFRGTEDLGGGLKADFVIEQGITPTANGGALFGARAGNAGQQGSVASPFAATSPLAAKSGLQTDTNRQTYFALSGANWGAVRIGYQYNNLYELGTLSGYNTGSEGVPGAYSSHLWGAAAVGGTRSNGLTYISPNFSGFTVRAQYGAAGANAETSVSNNAAGTLDENTGRRYSLMGQYANGPLSAALAYTSLKANAQSLSTVPAVAATSRTGSVTQLGASYDFGVAKLAGTYNNGKDGAAANTSYRAYQLGVSVPFGAIVPYITYGRAYSNKDGVVGRTADIRQTQIGVRYSLSKRTTAYAMYGQSTDDAATVANNFLYKDSKTIVGVMHTF